MNFFGLKVNFSRNGVCERRIVNALRRNLQNFVGKLKGGKGNEE